MKITLKQMQVFVNTAKYNSLSKGAEACFITQAAASMSLVQLEIAIGATLFDRIGKRLHINSNGQALLTKAMAIVDQAKEFEDYSTGDSGAVSGTIKIGASTTIANYVLPQRIAPFKSQYPEVEFEIIIANTKTIIKRIESLEIDFGLIEGFCNKHMIEQSLWINDTLDIICSKKHPLTKKKSVSITDLLKYSWAAREEGSGSRDVFENALQLKEPLNNEITLSSSEAIAAYVSSSQCLGYLSNTILNNKFQHKSLHSLSVKNLTLTRGFYKINHKKKYQTRQCKLFLGLLISK